jgi:predicted XRE-type DNA-binding protein
MQSFNNAFELLTDDTKEVENYTMRSNMMNAIVDLIKAKDWTQKEAAEHLGVSQPRISNLKNGRISKFSVDMLMGMLAKLGFTFEFNYTPKKQADVNMMSMTVNAAEVCA